MKSSGLRVLAVIVFLLAFAGANVGSFLLGRASAEHNSVSWEEASVFYAQIVERRENTLLVEGLPVNDVNHRGQFSFTLGEDTRLLWRGEEITQYMLAPEVAEKRDYMDTDCLAVSMDDTEPAGEFRLRKGVSGRVRGDRADKPYQHRAGRRTERTLAAADSKAVQGRRNPRSKSREHLRYPSRVGGAVR